MTASDELRAVADYYTEADEKIVQPGPAQILEALKHYMLPWSTDSCAS